MLNQPDSSGPSDWLMDAEGDASAQPDDIDRTIPNARNVLTSAEIEALLRPQLPDDFGEPAPPKTITPKPILDLQEAEAAPDHAAAAHRATRLSLALAKGAGFKSAISLSELSQHTSGTLLTRLQGRCEAVACFGKTERDVDVLVCLPAPMADAIIARACGARVSTGRLGDGWTLSAIDCALLHQLLCEVGSAFGPDMQLQAIETDLPYVASLIPEGALDIATYTVETPGLRSELQIVSATTAAPDTVTQAAPAAVPVTAIVTARMARLSVPLSRLSNLKAGSTLLLGLPVDQPVELLSGDHDGAIAFEGKLGRKGNQVAVKITRKLPRP